MKLKTYNNRLAESVWWNLLWLTIGAFFVTVCVKSVVASHAMLAGGVLGMALLVFYNTGLLTPLIWYLVLSIPIWVWGWFFVGRRFLLYTAYGTICTTIFGMFVDFQIPINNEVYAAVVAGVLHGTGVGMMLRTLGSGGGTDIIAMYLQKFAKMKFSTGILLADSCVVLSGLLVIGFGVGSGADREAVEGGSWLLSFYSLITIYVSSRVLAYVIDGASYDKLLFIISENHHAELRDFIIEDMDRSGTYIKGKGMYTDQDREMIFVVVSRKEVHLVQNKVREIDPKAFMVVTDAYETFGEGFKQFPDKDTIQAVG